MSPSCAFLSKPAKPCPRAWHSGLGRGRRSDPVHARRKALRLQHTTRATAADPRLDGGGVHGAGGGRQGLLLRQAAATATPAGQRLGAGASAAQRRALRLALELRPAAPAARARSRRRRELSPSRAEALHEPRIHLAVV